jgi:uncharacterized LabA/DUF88 family protein
MDSKPELPVYAFIDAQNLHKAMEEQGWKLSYRKFRVYLRDKFQVDKAFYFLGYMPEHKEMYQALRRHGYELVFKKILRFNSGETKGNVDAELVLNAMIQFHNFSQAVIVAGDGDYYCLAEYLEKTNKLKGIVIPNKDAYSSLLRSFGNKRHFISDLRRKLEYFSPK